MLLEFLHLGISVLRLVIGARGYVLVLASALHFPFCRGIAYAGVRFVGFQRIGRNHYLVNELLAGIIQAYPSVGSSVQCKIGVEGAAVRQTVCPEQGVLTGAYSGEHITFRDKIACGVTRVVAYLEVVTCQVGGAIRLVEHFNPCALNSVVVLKIVFVDYQHFIQNQLGV